MNRRKIVFKFFTADAYEKEEKFLHKMSLKGWHFVKFALFYVFEKGEPKSYTYKMDFKKNIPEDMDNYITLYKDCGWEQVGRMNLLRGSWFYYRKEILDGKDEDLFTDHESKIELFKQIRTFYIYLAIFLGAINLSNFLNLYNLMQRQEHSVGIFLMCLYGIVVMLYAKVFIGISLKIRELKKRSTDII